MKISISADSLLGVAAHVPEWVRERGHTVILHGALDPGSSTGWADCSAAAASDVAEGRADQAVICCFTGTGASIAANKVAGVRAALCTDAFSAAGARKWNDANALCLSLRLVSAPVLQEMLDAWFAATVDPAQAGNIGIVEAMDRRTP